ncbi:MAG TPA: hypothetical protein VJP88_04975 [Caulobacteraceae bacterium]|nr:hypothetical protein [Caulobacteraceae bacterium]
MATSENITFFSICSAAYLAQARCLFRSLREHHAAAKLKLVLIDQAHDARNLLESDIDIVLAKDIAGDIFYQLALDYDAEELSAALKPFAFRYFLSHDDSPIAYVAPDSFAYSHFHELMETLASGANIVLTPRNTRPIGHGRTPNEAGLLADGAINPGLIAVAPGPEAAAFLSWWSSRVAGPKIAGATQVPHDRWLDLVPSFFEGAHIHKHPGYGVAHWNIFQRVMTRRGAAWFADGAPLRLFHFSRLPLDDITAFATDQDRLAADAIGPFRNELESYLARLASCGTPAESAYPYALMYEGQQIDSRGLRQALRNLELSGRSDSPKTFAAAEDAIGELLAPPPGLPAHEPFPISRLLYARWAASPKLQAEFPLFDGAQRARFLYWAMTAGYVDLDIPLSLLPWRELGRPVANPLAKHVQLPAVVWMIWLAEPQVRQACPTLNDMGVARLLGHLLEDIYTGKRPGTLFQAAELGATVLGEGRDAVSLAELAVWTGRKDLQGAFDLNTLDGRTAFRRWVEQFPPPEAPWTPFAFPLAAQVAHA